MKVTILGCGGYGLALAKTFLSNGNKVVMWSKFQKEVDNLDGKYPELSFETDMAVSTLASDLIVIAIPVAFLEETIFVLKKCYLGQDILIASKGIDTEKQRFAYEIVIEHLENAKIGVISGGTFAVDMVERKVMGLTLGTKAESIKEKVKTGLENKFLKIQYIEDMIGVSVCGAIKNVMAIGFGMLDGANYPPSSRFLFLTRAIYEIDDFIKSLGGSEKTIMSYAGIDDIMMTCTSSQSRNYTFGKMIGEELPKADINDYKSRTTIEGLGTAKAIYTLSQDKQIDLPLAKIIYDILYNNKSHLELIKYLELAG